MAFQFSFTAFKIKSKFDLNSKDAKFKAHSFYLTASKTISSFNEKSSLTLGRVAKRSEEYHIDCVTKDLGSLGPYQSGVSEAGMEHKTANNGASTTPLVKKEQN